MREHDTIRLVQPVKRGSVRRAIARINREIEAGADFRDPTFAPDLHKAVVIDEFWRRDFETANATWLRAVSLLALASDGESKFAKAHPRGIFEIPGEICDAADIAICAECAPFDAELLCEAMPVVGGIQ